ncbi:pyruvate ferredoxin/flavodoxin oxidoreductase [Lucifera butyrica]|uniref:Pyruvate ferredoxin/flavodoxin oxidoreductase n=1 Tax=Lucifera butyrica TaxID=1351585 RepID=A0A498R1A1_9FIRM|nr:2-oxoacid:acceptor oxidoreductase subunit alpha [Lucifera butyrica]VBB06356.1 pyruvate ferredoxin/flavodoxin oxidoreductase [Lucifera butyrica]
MKQYYTCLFGGEAGYGVMSAGAMVGKGAGRNGLWSVVVNEYPSLIKGGLNSCLVRLADEPLHSYQEGLDFLGAMSQPAYDGFAAQVKKGGIILYDSGAVKVNPETAPDGVRLIPVGLVQSVPGDAARVMANSALLGAFCALTGFPQDILTQVMATEFPKAEVAQQNISLLTETYKRVAAGMAEQPKFPLAFSPGAERKMLLNGNDAIAMGAVQGGCQFAAGYPMTPGSSILVYLADHGPEYGLVFKQAEDEIAAMNMLIGASFAGARVIGATSGGGFSLMVEALGFAAQAELPVVMVEAQRGGPSTGLPTRTMQADLDFVTYASQGEFPRLVVAPGDIEECFYETCRLFNLTDKYQVPGIILTDKYLADTAFTRPHFDTSGLGISRGKLADETWLAANQPYKRYQLTADGVSVRAFPGQAGGRHIATSYTHGEDGFYSSGNREHAAAEPATTTAGIDKWYRKVPFMEADIPGVKLYGPAEAELTVIAWGSTKGAVLEAMEEACQDGMSVNFLQVLYMAPFPAQQMNRLLKTVKKSLLVEGNKTGQLGRMIRAYTGYKTDDSYLKYDSRPFVPAGILAKIKEVLA